MELEELETAINAYIDSDKNALTKFVGKCGGLEPFGEKDLGMYINEGDFANVDKILNKITTFSLFKKKYKSSGNPYFDKSVSLLNKLEKAKPGHGADLFKKVIDFLLTKRKETGTYPKISKSLVKIGVTESEWDNVANMLTY